MTTTPQRTCPLHSPKAALLTSGGGRVSPPPISSMRSRQLSRLRNPLVIRRCSSMSPLMASVPPFDAPWVSK